MEESADTAVAQVRSGDRDAFRLLVEQHSRAIFRLAYRMTGNEQDAEDVVQETFLRAYRTFDRYESRSSFGTWLHRIAANYAIDLLRARQRFRRHQEAGDGQEQPSLLERLPASSPLPDRLAVDGEVRQRVGGALKLLTPQERAAFVLRHFEGQSIETIGSTLGLAPSATKHSIFRAVQKLRRALEPFVSTTA